MKNLVVANSLMKGVQVTDATPPTQLQQTPISTISYANKQRLRIGAEGDPGDLPKQVDLLALDVPGFNIEHVVCGLLHTQERTIRRELEASDSTHVSLENSEGPGWVSDVPYPACGVLVASG